MTRAELHARADGLAALADAVELVERDLADGADDFERILAVVLAAVHELVGTEETTRRGRDAQGGPRLEVGAAPPEGR